MKTILLMLFLSFSAIAKENYLPEYCQEKTSSEAPILTNSSVYCYQGKREEVLHSSVLDTLSQFQSGANAAYSSHLIEELEKIAISSNLGKRYNALSIFPEHLNTLKTEDANSCSDVKKILARKNAGGKSNQRARARKSSPPKTYETDPVQEKIEVDFFSRHLKMAQMIAPWMQRAAKVRKEISSEKYKALEKVRTKCHEKYRNKKTSTQIVKTCQQDDQDTLTAVEEINQNFEKKENESLRPLLAVRKAYPALFDHPKNNLGFTATIDKPGDFMQKLLQVSKGKIKNNIESESDKKFSEHLSQIANGKSGLVQKDFQTLLDGDDKDQEAYEKLALEMRKNKDLREEAIDAIDAHVSMLEKSAESICDKTYFYGADKKPIIHHHTSLVEEHIRRLIAESSDDSKDPEKLKNEITLVKAAHCQLLEKYPPDGEVSYAALGGLGALGMGALAYATGGASLVVQGLFLAGGSVLGAVGVKDYIDSEDQYQVGRSAAEGEWADFSDYQKVYRDLAQTRNVNFGLGVVLLPLSAFDVQAVKHSYKATKNLENLFKSKNIKHSDISSESKAAYSIKEMEQLNYILTGKSKEEAVSILKDINQGSRFERSSKISSLHNGELAKGDLKSKEEHLLKIFGHKSQAEIIRDISLIDDPKLRAMMVQGLFPHLTAAQVDAIMKAHDLPGELNNLSKGEIRSRVEVMRAAGIDSDTIRLALKYGISGKNKYHIARDLILQSEPELAAELEKYSHVSDTTKIPFEMRDSVDRLTSLLLNAKGEERAQISADLLKNLKEFNMKIVRVEEFPNLKTLQDYIGNLEKQKDVSPVLANAIADLSQQSTLEEYRLALQLLNQESSRTSDLEKLKVLNQYKSNLRDHINKYEVKLSFELTPEQVKQREERYRYYLDKPEVESTVRVSRTIENKPKENYVGIETEEYIARNPVITDRLGAGNPALDKNGVPKIDGDDMIWPDGDPKLPEPIEKPALVRVKRKSEIAHEKHQDWAQNISQIVDPSLATNVGFRNALKDLAKDIGNNTVDVNYLRGKLTSSGLSADQIDKVLEAGVFENIMAKEFDVDTFIGDILSDLAPLKTKTDDSLYYVSEGAIIPYAGKSSSSPKITYKGKKYDKTQLASDIAEQKRLKSQETTPAVVQSSFADEIADYGYTADSIAKDTGISKDYVESYLNGNAPLSSKLENYFIEEGIIVKPKEGPATERLGKVYVNGPLVTPEKEAHVVEKATVAKPKESPVTEPLVTPETKLQIEMRQYGITADSIAKDSGISKEYIDRYIAGDAPLTEKLKSYLQEEGLPVDSGVAIPTPIESITLSQTPRVDVPDFPSQKVEAVELKVSPPTPSRTKPAPAASKTKSKIDNVNAYIMDKFGAKIDDLFDDENIPLELKDELRRAFAKLNLQDINSKDELLSFVASSVDNYFQNAKKLTLNPNDAKKMISSFENVFQETPFKGLYVAYGKHSLKADDRLRGVVSNIKGLEKIPSDFVSYTMAKILFSKGEIPNRSRPYLKEVKKILGDLAKQDANKLKTVSIDEFDANYVNQIISGKPAAVSPKVEIKPTAENIVVQQKVEQNRPGPWDDLGKKEKPRFRKLASALGEEKAFSFIKEKNNLPDILKGRINQIINDLNADNAGAFIEDGSFAKSVLKEIQDIAQDTSLPQNVIEGNLRAGSYFYINEFTDLGRNHGGLVDSVLGNEYLESLIMKKPAEVMDRLYFYSLYTKEKGPINTPAKRNIALDTYNKLKQGFVSFDEKGLAGLNLDDPLTFIKSKTPSAKPVESKIVLNRRAGDQNTGNQNGPSAKKKERREQRRRLAERRVQEEETRQPASGVESIRNYEIQRPGSIDIVEHLKNKRPIEDDVVYYLPMVDKEKSTHIMFSRGVYGELTAEDKRAIEATILRNPDFHFVEKLKGNKNIYEFRDNSIDHRLLGCKDKKMNGYVFFKGPFTHDELTSKKKDVKCHLYKSPF